MVVFAHPVLIRGALRIVTNVERGMRWTPWLRRTSEAEADGEVVWSWPPDAEVKFCDTFCRATVAKKPGAPRRARSSR
jgi:hypothetical protein